MKRALAFALLALNISIGASFAVPANPANPTAGTSVRNIATHDPGPLSETDIEALVGARSVCSLDISIARQHFAMGNVAAGTAWLLVAYFRPAVCS